MNKGKKLYEGKAKIIYEGPEKGTAIQHFKDDTTAFNALLHLVIVIGAEHVGAIIFRVINQLCSKNEHIL